MEFDSKVFFVELLHSPVCSNHEEKCIYVWHTTGKRNTLSVYALQVDLGKYIHSFQNGCLERSCEWTLETDYLSASTKILRASEVFNVTAVGKVSIGGGC